MGFDEGHDYSGPYVVPRDFFFLWTGATFPRINVVALERLRHHESTARITVYFVDCSPTSSTLEAIARVADIDVSVIESSDVLANLPLELNHVKSVFDRLPPNALSARSNLVRYAILLRSGGIYLDFDVFTVRRLDDELLTQCFIGEESVWNADQRRVAGAWWVCLAPRNIAWALVWFAKWLDGLLFFGCLQLARRLSFLNPLWSRRQVNNAIIGARPNSQFIENVLLDSATADPSVRYATGPTLVDRVARRDAHTVRIIGPDHFYAIPPGDSHRIFRDRTMVLPHSAVFVHYAASNHKRLIAKFEETGRWWGSSRSLAGGMVRSSGFAEPDVGVVEPHTDWCAFLSPTDERGILL